ncbi:hypothetical protein LTR10_011339 [Elasticomyces elasticus]|nr:hypothetical protein LTR10_011339 [Elasticomyces elasticus]KAK4966248.1 hypothetical protein LTR42_011409 [Elasticomyces elasticus]
MDDPPLAVGVREDNLYHHHLAASKIAADSIAADEHMSDHSLDWQDSHGSSSEALQHINNTTSVTEPSSVHTNQPKRSIVSPVTTNNTAEPMCPPATAEPSDSLFVKATPTSHLPWISPRPSRHLPPVGNFALPTPGPPRRPLKRRRAKKGEVSCGLCKMPASLMGMEECIQCSHLRCLKWFHLVCVGHDRLPQGRYGWTCEECDPEDQNNGLHSMSGVRWLGSDDENN